MIQTQNVDTKISVNNDCNILERTPYVYSKREQIKRRKFDEKFSSFKFEPYSKTPLIPTPARFSLELASFILNSIVNCHNVKKIETVCRSWVYKTILDIQNNYLQNRDSLVKPISPQITKARIHRVANNRVFSVIVFNTPNIQNMPEISTMCIWFEQDKEQWIVTDFNLI